jgi:ATP-binding cassette, subfamily B, bacterial IrtB/YbtQ
VSGIHDTPDTRRSAGRRPGAVRRIWQLAGRAGRRGMLGAVACRVVWAILMALAIVQLVAVVDDVRRQQLDTADVVRIVAVYAVLFAGQVTANYWSNRLSWTRAFDLGADVRLAALDRLRRLPLGFHAGRDQGDTLTALTQDVVAVETFAHAPLPALVGALAGPLCVAVLLTLVDLRLAAVTIVSVAAAVPVYLVANRIFDRLALRRQDTQAEATGRIVEYLQGIAVIRAFNLGGERLDRFRRSLDDLRAVNTRLAVAILPLATCAMTVVELGIPLLIAIGGYWLAGGTVDAGTLVVFLVLALRVYQPLVHAADQLEQLRIADASLQRVARLLDEPEQPTPEAVTATPADHGIRLHDVHFGYDHHQPVLHGVDLTVPAGTTCALVGPSGAGKTTVTRLVARFFDVDAGSVRIGGADVRSLGTEAVMALVSPVFQDVYLFDGTIAENVRLGRPSATDDELSDAARAARVDEIVERLRAGWDTRVGEGGTTLSGGERQRVSIARALLKDAPIVLLDEATAALDPENEAAVQDALAALARDRTVLVIAHRLQTIAAADRIAMLDGGRITELGSHDELLAAGGRYARFWTERTRARGWRIGTPQEAVR